MITQEQIKSIIVRSNSVDYASKTLDIVFKREVLRDSIKVLKGIKYSDGVAHEMEDFNDRIDFKITELEKQLKELE